MKVKIENIVDALEFLVDESCGYLNKKTGEVITLIEEELRAAE